MPVAGQDCYISDHVDIGMGINAATPNMDAAKTFMSWVASPAFAEIYANALPGFFPLSSAKVNIKDPVAKTFVSWRDQCKSTIRNSYQILSRGTPNLENDLWNVSAQVLNKTMTPEEAGKKVQEGLDSWYHPRQVGIARELPGRGGEQPSRPGRLPEARIDSFSPGKLQFRLRARLHSGEPVRHDGAGRAREKGQWRKQAVKPRSHGSTPGNATPWTTYIVAFLAPAAIVYTVFSIYPLFDTIRLSLYTADGSGNVHFTGFANFVTLLTDPRWAGPFWNAFRNNLIFFAIHMIVQNSIGLALAVLLSLPALAGRSVYRTLIFLPTMLSFVIIGFIWQLILSPLWGIAKGALNVFGLGGLFAPWLGLEGTALVTISLISVWQFVGIPMMLIYAALLNIPDDLVDAATVDGANQWHVFWSIKLPLILPTLGRGRHPHLRRQLQRLRPDLHGQGRARRAELLHRHPRHVLLPHLLRQPAPAGQPDHGRHRGDHDAAHHPGRRARLPVRRAAPHAALHLVRGAANEQAARLAHGRPRGAHPLHAAGARAGAADPASIRSSRAGRSSPRRCRCPSASRSRWSATIRCCTRRISASTSSTA